MNGDLDISEEHYYHYDNQRRTFGIQARDEIITEFYPGRKLRNLNKYEHGAAHKAMQTMDFANF